MSNTVTDLLEMAFSLLVSNLISFFSKLSFQEQRYAFLLPPFEEDRGGAELITVNRVVVTLSSRDANLSNQKKKKEMHP
jgi:hypothetical protein